MVLFSCFQVGSRAGPGALPFPWPCSGARGWQPGAGSALTALLPRLALVPEAVRRRGLRFGVGPCAGAHCGPHPFPSGVRSPLRRGKGGRYAGCLLFERVLGASAFVGLGTGRGFEMIGPVAMVQELDHYGNVFLTSLSR